MVSSFTVVMRTTIPVERMFDQSLSIDEHMASMAHTGERAIAGVMRGSIGLGETVTWRARHFGIRFTMTSQITGLDRPARFVDEQVSGPFRSFHHEHAFTCEDDTTVMVDTLTIASPVFGRLAERTVLVPYLRRLIRRRNRHLLASLGAAAYEYSDVSARVGRGDEVWERASREVLTWKVKTRSGFAVDDPRPVASGARLTVTSRVLGVTVREPVVVTEVVDTPTRVGFTYRTLPRHPVTGEESFIVDRRGDEVFLTVRSLTRPASTRPWRALFPLLRIAQVVARRRYLRALR